ncbi:MAG: zinc-dependent alcohol dehydrogenase family protein [Myxococcaceae bacterium]
MKAWAIERFGLDGLCQRERPSPVAGPGQVVVAVKATSLNFRDLLTVQGHYNPNQPLPLIPLSDGAGVVSAVGPGVTRVRPGDRVMSVFASAWRSGLGTREEFATSLGGPNDGMLAQHVLLSAEGVVKTPPHLSDEEAATLPCAALTAWSALVTLGGVMRGHTVLIEGTGGVSVAALQFAKMLGARAFVTSSSDEKLARAVALGAEAGLNYKKEPAWGKKAREWTGGKGFDHVLDVGGAGTLNEALRAVRFGGTVSVVGMLSGRAGDINLIPVMMQNVRLQGVTVGSRDSFEDMCRAISVSGTRPVIDRTFSFAEVRQAFEHLASGTHFGKIVVRVAEQ